MKEVIKDKIREGGLNNLFISALRFSWRRSIRKLVPKKENAKLNGIKVTSKTRPSVKYFDLIFEIKNNDESFEGGLVKATEKVLKEDDTVTIIGGGQGVSAIKASKKADNVVVYEGGSEQAKYISENAELNNIKNLEVITGIVGPEVDVYGAGETSSSKTVGPKELQEADILQLDCEGSEEAIIKEIEIEPKAIFVEFHPFNFAEDWENVISELEEKGYSGENYYGHDGVEISENTFRQLMNHSEEEGQRYVKDARWPVVGLFRR